MPRNYKNLLLEGLWERLARYGRGAISQRVFLVGEITHLLSCDTAD